MAYLPDMISNTALNLSPVAFWPLAFTIVGLVARSVIRRRKLLVELPSPPPAGWIKGLSPPTTACRL